MNRIQIQPPQSILFTTDITVQIGDINYGNHLANDAVLRLCHEARLRFLSHFGFTETNIDGVSLIMADAAIQYQGQAFYGDTLHFQLGIRETTSAGFILVYQIHRLPENTPIACVQTGLVFFDYLEKKVRKTPPIFTQRILNTLQQ